MWPLTLSNIYADSNVQRSSALICGSEYYYTPWTDADTVPLFVPLGARWRPFAPLASEIPMFYFPESSYILYNPLPVQNEQSFLAPRPPLLLSSDWSFVTYGPERWALATEWQNQQPNVYLGAFWIQYPYANQNSFAAPYPTNFNCSIQFQGGIVDSAKYVSRAIFYSLSCNLSFPNYSPYLSQMCPVKD